MAYNVFIAGADSAYNNFLSSALSRVNGLKISGTASDGLHALTAILSGSYDILLLDPQLPGLDGLCILKELQKAKHLPVIICISEFYSSLSVELARRNGADYFVYKPISPESLAVVLLECASLHEQNRNQETISRTLSANDVIHREISSLLSDMGFSPRYAGCSYIANAVAIAHKSPLALHNLSNGLYRQLAERANVSAACIERSIRTAITTANAYGKLSAILEGEVTNKTFLQYLLRRLNEQLQ